MCHQCPAGRIECAEPVCRCAFCAEEPALDHLRATAAMAAHALVHEGDALCRGCHGDIADDLARVPCTLCGRREDPRRVDYVDLLGGAVVAVCRGCYAGLERDAAEAAANALRDACLADLESGDLVVFVCEGELPALPWERGLDPAHDGLAPANDAADPGEAA